MQSYSNRFQEFKYGAGNKHNRSPLKYTDELENDPVSELLHTAHVF